MNFTVIQFHFKFLNLLNCLHRFRKSAITFRSDVYPSDHNASENFCNSAF